GEEKRGQRVGLTDSNFKQPTLRRPYSLIGAGYAVFPIPILRSLEGSGAPADAGVCETPDGWPARPSGGTLCEGVPSLPKKRGAFRRSTAACLMMCGPRFRNVDQPRPSASSWQQVVLPASGAPPSPECHEVRFPEARGAASADGGVSPLGRPGEFWAHLRLSLTAAPSSRRPMTTPLEEQDTRTIYNIKDLSIVLCKEFLLLRGSRRRRAR